MHNQLEVARLLMGAAADVNARDAWGTPLHYAIKYNNPTMAEYLSSVGGIE